MPIYFCLFVCPLRCVFKCASLGPGAMLCGWQRLCLIVLGTASVATWVIQSACSSPSSTRQIELFPHLHTLKEECGPGLDRCEWIWDLVQAAKRFGRTSRLLTDSLLDSLPMTEMETTNNRAFVLKHLADPLFRFSIWKTKTKLSFLDWLSYDLSDSHNYTTTTTTFVF